ncbi:MAG: FeoB-associated Cys-rich membrane protein [Eubacteriales bacterium]|nr:FeoB-associated Cys-rich membrane protein [Eubacteriales bacterium]MDD3200141.1 FeoB-associated Cys-rich membrane protein [Eubacteriales bacterium]MDD4630409.1 FeoB-associated Cys-rich membrane protein [Eubacteriales bacterium]
MAKIVIGVIIAVYVGYLIYRQVKNIKARNFCGSCCGCPSAKSCSRKSNKGDES